MRSSEHFHARGRALLLVRLVVATIHRRDAVLCLRAVAALQVKHTEKSLGLTASTTAGEPPRNDHSRDAWSKKHTR